MMKSPFVSLAPFVWQIEPQFKKGMRVPARLLASRKILQQVEEEALEQLINLTFLPGIVEAAWAMPDIHVGYGAPIGAVFATDPQAGGVVSPGAIGFDINCGVRLLVTDKKEEDWLAQSNKLLSRLFAVAGAGVGAQSQLSLDPKELTQVCQKGASWVVEQGWGEADDLLFCEEKGCLAGADLAAVSPQAQQRGQNQLGTLGSGNHYLEIQRVDKIENSAAAAVLGLKKEGQLTIMIHCGSRGLGHQIATDYLREFEQNQSRTKITLPDRQLSAAPLNSSAGKRYLAAMAAAVNFAFANRQLLTHKIRQVLGWPLKLVYDVAHNVAKWEKLPTLKKEVLVHRKGATRAWGPGRAELPSAYRRWGQPVLVGGSLETASWVLLGTKKAERLTFASTCHGAGRVMSRTAAKKKIQGRKYLQQLRQKGIEVRTASFAGLAEEAGLAYKDVDEVVAAVIQAGVSRPVARLTPLAVIKG